MPATAKAAFQIFSIVGRGRRVGSRRDRQQGISRRDSLKIIGAALRRDAEPPRLPARRRLQPRQKRHRRVAIRTAHLLRRPQTRAHRGPLGAAENRAAIIRQELHATFARAFAPRHSGNRRRDRGRDAARAAACTAVHGKCHVMRNAFSGVTPGKKFLFRLVHGRDQRAG